MDPALLQKQKVEYFEKQLKQAHRPDRKEYYRKMLAKVTGKKYKPKEVIYSEVLDMEFKSTYEASRYIGKSGAYVWQIIAGKVKKNPYGFKKIKKR